MGPVIWTLFAQKQFFLELLNTFDFNASYKAAILAKNWLKWLKFEKLP